MRNYIFALAFLSLFACAWANNVAFGKRVPGDKLFQSRSVSKSKVPGIRQSVTIDAVAPIGKVISYVSTRTLDGTENVEVKRISGSIGTRRMRLEAIGERSEPLDIIIEIYAVAPTEPSSTKPTSSEPSRTTPSSTKPSSAEPSSTETSSAEPSSTESNSGEPSSTEPNSGEPTSTEPNSGEPTSTEPSSGEPSSTEPSNAASTVFFNLQLLYFLLIWLYH